MDAPEKHVRIVSPLLRKEVTERKPTAGDALLAHVTQPGLKTELLKTHEQHPEIRMDGFHSGVSAPDHIIDDT